MSLNFFRKEKPLTEEEQMLKWEKEGRPAPPPHAVKQKAIAQYRSDFGLETLVETGTYLGDMVEAQRLHFKQIFSIELSERLYRKAAKRFEAYSHIRIRQGDSGTVLPQVIAQLTGPALFWLDGHYSGGITALGDKECPVPEEMEAILGSRMPHVILIDDARLFNGTKSYPTIQTIMSINDRSSIAYKFDVQDDIIRLTPVQAA